MKNLFLIVISCVVILNSQEVCSQNQSAINTNGSYSSIYDFANQYFNNPTYQPSNTKPLWTGSP